MKNTIILFAVATMLLAGCAQDQVQQVSSNDVLQLSKADQAVSNASAEFGFDMLEQLHQEKPNENQVISPMSVSMALGMLYNGTQGATKQELKKGLGFENMSDQAINDYYHKLLTQLPALDKEVALSIGNAVFHDEKFSAKQSYMDVVDQQFMSQITPLDFRNPQAKKQINSWVDNQTKGKIKQIVDQIPPQAVMYLINALYFKGQWTEPFDEEATSEGTFTKADGSTYQTPFMQKKYEWKTWQNESFTAVDLPYGHEKFSMTLLLPDETANLGSLIGKLDRQMLEDIDEKMEARNSILKLPKFKLEYEKSMKDLLTAMGMGTMFSKSEADLHGISDRQLFVEEVKHKTFIEVDEKGTEAAAATSVGIGVTSMPPTVSFDRPFLFLIRTTGSNNVIFSGKVMEPKVDGSGK